MGFSRDGGSSYPLTRPAAVGLYSPRLTGRECPVRGTRMSEDLYAPNTYWLQFPVWFLVDEEVFHQRGMPDAIISLTSEGYGEFLPVFTDKDLARRCAQEQQLKGYSYVRAPDAEHLLTVLRYVQELGTKYVGYDAGRSKAVYQPIDEAIRTYGPSDERAT
jgi:hypothetical protein